MKYRLGLDLGTTSIGAVALTLTDPDEPIEILTQRLRLFPEPVEPNAQGVLQTKKAAYRVARQQRTQINRRAKRLRKIAKLAEHWGLDHKTIAPDNGQHLPRLRALAATEQVTLEDLLRIFLKLAKRRGYAGGFRTQSDESGEVKSGVERLRNIMQERGCDTLGQYLYDRHQRGLPIHLKIKTTGSDTGGKKQKNPPLTLKQKISTPLAN